MGKHDEKVQKQEKKKEDSLSGKQKARWERKKNKIEAFLNVARLNEEDQLKEQKPQSSANVTTHSKNEDTGMALKQAVKQEAKQSNRVISDGELEKLRAELRERQKKAMEKAKIYPVLDWVTVRCEVCPGDEKKASQSEISLQPSMEVHHPLFAVDLQQLLLYALQGNVCNFKPRWCKVLRPGKVSQVVVMEVTGVTKNSFLTHQEQFSELKKQGFTMCVEVISPAQYNSSFLEEISSVPLSFSQLNKRDRQIQSLDQQKSDHKTMHEPAPAIKFVQNVSSVSGSRGNSFSRLSLLLSTEQMMLEHFPLPVDMDKHEDFVYSQEEYATVNEYSPIYAVDCEMCITSIHQYELTRIAIVNERLETVYETLVKPENPITQYLTKFSGITKGLLANVKTRLSDVQRKMKQILPPDAILCGQSLNGDLKALKMFHPYVIDTSIIYNFTGTRTHKPGLKKLANVLLRKEIQNSPSGHHPVEDAVTTMELVQLKLRNGPCFGDVIVGGSLQLDKPTGNDDQPMTVSADELNSTREQKLSSESSDLPTMDQSEGTYECNSKQNCLKRSICDEHSSDGCHGNTAEGSSVKKQKLVKSECECPKNGSAESDSCSKITLQIQETTSKCPECDSKAKSIEDSVVKDTHSPLEDSSVNRQGGCPDKVNSNQQLIFFRKPGSSETQSFFALANESKRRVTLIGNKSMLSPWSSRHNREDIHHIHTESNTFCCRFCTCAMDDDNFMVWTQFHCRNGPGNPELENIEELQYDVKKILKKCKPSTLAMLLLTGDKVRSSRSNAVCLVKVT